MPRYQCWILCAASRPLDLTEIGFMETADLLPKFGRRLRIGLVGGGSDSVIGRTHIMAMRVDGYYELAAGAMSIDPAIAIASARREFIATDRIYTSYREMAQREAARPDGIDVVAIATPPQTHREIAETFLRHGIDVICEKPLTRDLNEATGLVRVIVETGRLFCLTHCYTGYPMVRQARAIVRLGLLGRIRLIEGELSAGDPGVAREPLDPATRHWRFRRDSMGIAALLGEVGSHAYNLATYITGISATAVSANMSTVAARREVYDNAYLTLRYTRGAQGRIWASYVATGSDQGLWFRIFGEEGSLTWHQEKSAELWHKPLGGPAVCLAPGYDSLAPQSLAASRLRPGHPEGYVLAFANLYTEFAQAIIARNLQQPHQAYLDSLPGIQDGVAGMALINAATRSHDHQGAWTPIFPG
jgi:predicted dehydrogenase